MKLFFKQCSSDRGVVRRRKGRWTQTFLPKNEKQKKKIIIIMIIIITTTTTIKKAAAARVRYDKVL